MTFQVPAQPVSSEQILLHTVTPSSQIWLLSTSQVWGLIVLTLHLAAPQLPEAIAWSVWPYTLFPAWVRWTLALLAATLVIAPVNDALTKCFTTLIKLTPLAPPEEGEKTSILPFEGLGGLKSWFVAAALLAGLIFWLARLRHLRWGDSYMLSVALSYPDLELRVIYNWQAPLTVFLHQRLWQFVAQPLLGWSVETVYATISILCGIIFVYVLLSFTARLGRSPLEAVVLAGFVLTTGSIQLFFGYVENYTIISLGLLVTLFLAWRTLQGELEPLWPVVGLSLTNAFHPSTVFLWPGMVLLVWLCQRRGYISTGKAWAQLVIPPLLIGGGVFALMESGGHGLSAFLGVDRPGGGDGLWFVPLFETTTRWQHYTMFSVAHILDWSNLHLLISPFGLPIILTALLATHRFGLTLFTRETDRDYALFLGVTSAMYLLLTWLWNPDYGGQKDWDLFAPAAFVYTLFAGYLWIHLLSDKTKLRRGSLFVLAVSLIHTGAWIFTNTLSLPRE